MQNIIAAKHIFTGSTWLHDAALVVNNGVIEKILYTSDLPSDIEWINDGFLAPGFIDVQVYGAASKLFAVYPDTRTLQLMQQDFASSGTVLFQPTLATNTLEVFKSGVDAVKAFWQEGGTGVHGLHLEGPWLNVDKRGAHIEQLIHAPDVAEVKELMEYGKGVITMVTLAPEVCSTEIIQLIQSYNVVVAAGHSAASYQQAMASFDKGIHAVTHLYNAMSGLHHREPGLVGATLHDDDVYASIIPDGHHVDFAAIAIAKKVMGERLYAITDAVTETTDGPYRHHLSGNKYECDGVLSGSSLSMHQAFLNLIQKVGLSIEESLRMCSTYPATLLGCNNQYGNIQPGASAQVIYINESLDAVKMFNAKTV